MDTTPPPVDFYAGKSKDLPRFAYRNLAAALQSAADYAGRVAVLATFVETLKANAGKGDFLKFKWVMPPFLRTLLSGDEQVMVDRTLAEIRTRQSTKLFGVYPHCADEFSLDAVFIEAAFDATPNVLFDKTTPIFTIGSCFARNISRFLAERRFNVQTFSQVEDLNSPHSNAAMLAAATATPEARAHYLRQWLMTILVGYAADVIDQTLQHEIVRLEQLRQSIADSRVLIVTLGNTIDYHFGADSAAPVLDAVSVAPKFLAITDNESVNLRVAFGAIAQKLGATLRLATYFETLAALRGLHRSIRSINPAAPIIYTLSPVPIDSAIGLQSARYMGPIEIDCISKSTLRTAINDFLSSDEAGEQAYYFPSYELVRWVGAMLPAPNFGEQDAASRHVSSEILNAIYCFFLKKHGSA